MEGTHGRLRSYIIDPDFIDELYVGPSKRKTDLWSWTVNFFAALAMIPRSKHGRVAD